MVFMQDLWNFSYFGRRDVSPTHSELLCFVSESQAKHQISSPVIILLKKILSASANAINVLARYDLILPLLGCQGLWKQNVHTTLSLPNPLSESEELQFLGCSKILLSFLM